MLLLGCGVVYVLWLGQARLAFAAGSPGNTDLGGHIVALRHLIDVSLPAGHLHDWSHQWFGGYPSFYFYFPLPALLIAALSLILPLESAAKLVAVAAPALLPVCTYVFVRNAGFSRSHACAGALAAVTSLSLTTQYIRGGNVLSSVIGEYSYSLGLCLAVLYAGRISKAARGSDESVALSIMLGLCALTHLIPTLFAVFVSFGFVVDRRMRRQVLASWVVGFALSAFWSVPFLLRMPFMADLHRNYGAQLSDILPLPVVMVLPFTVAAVVLLRRRLNELRALLVLAASALLFYLVPQSFFAQARAMPLWYFSIYVFTSLGLVHGLRHGTQTPARRVILAAGIVALAGLSIAQAQLVRDRSAALLSSQRPDSDAHDRLIATLDTLPPGRLHWENRPGSDNLLGSPVALARIPFEAPHIASTFGLLIESGFMTPVYSHLNALIRRGEGRTALTMLRMLGIDYFVSFTAATTAWASQYPELLRPLASTDQWQLWDVNAAPLVEPIDLRPDTTERGSWRDQVGQWIMAVEAGAVDSAADSAAVPHAVVRDIVLTHRGARFVTDAPGTPHLVRVAFFPNWRTSDGTGPVAAAPGFMLVVPHQPEVELRFERTWVEIGGMLLSLIGVAVTAGLIVRRRSFNTRKSSVPADRRHGAPG